MLKPINWSYLRHGLIIWLDAPLNVLVKRLEADTTRPLLQETALEDKLGLLLQQRQSLYAESDLQISIEPLETPESIVERILDKIPSILKQPFLEREEN